MTRLPPAAGVLRCVLRLPPAPLGIAVRAARVTELRFYPAWRGTARRAAGPPADDDSEALLQSLGEALLAYFGERRALPRDLPLAHCGTPFQRRVWRALAAVPMGGVVSYGDLARRLHSGARAIGGACAANPFPVLIPCHRVVAADGGLGGYTAATGRVRARALKRWLLHHEGVAGFDTAARRTH